jgi:hypothetical protein
MPPEQRDPRRKDGVLVILGTLATLIEKVRQPCLSLTCSRFGDKSLCWYDGLSASLVMQKLAGSLEQLLVTHVFPEFQSPHGFMRFRCELDTLPHGHGQDKGMCHCVCSVVLLIAFFCGAMRRSCWMLERFNDVDFTSDQVILAATDFVLSCLKDPDLPVRVMVRAVPQRALLPSEPISR